MHTAGRLLRSECARDGDPGARAAFLVRARTMEGGGRSTPLPIRPSRVASVRAALCRCSRVCVCVSRPLFCPGARVPYCLFHARCERARGGRVAIRLPRTKHRLTCS